MEGKKYDSGKVPLGLFPREAIIEICKVLDFGAKKYGRDNWRKGMKWTRVSDAALRHLFAWISGDDYDDESGINHLAHCGCCIAFLLVYQICGFGEDDRYVKDCEIEES